MTQPPPRVYSEEFDDIYFSPEDGVAETRHVFLDGNNLSARFIEKPGFTICETGFGTGLNFLMAWEAYEGCGEDLHFLSFEKYPLSKEKIYTFLSLQGEDRGALRTQDALVPLGEGDNLKLEEPPHQDNLHSRTAHQDCLSSPCRERMTSMLASYPDTKAGRHDLQITDSIRLTLIFGDVNDEIPKLETPVDAWFLDGFAPAKNPDMWSDKVFENMARLSEEGTTFATFTAAGFVKRGLSAAGFEVEKVKGFGRKREMLRGVYRGA